MKVAAAEHVETVRLVSLPLMIGLVAMPAIFVWLLLRRGYPNSLRQAAFAYAFGPAALVLSASIAAGVFNP